MDERIGARVHARLGRQLHPSCRERTVRLLDEIQLLRDLRKETCDLFASEIEEPAHV
jgi:hypothetical protein